MKSIILFSIVFILAIAADVMAHGVRGVIISKKGVLAEAEYDDGEAMSYSAVEVFCGEETLPFQSGTTDRNGRFLFLPDKPGIWKIIVKDGMGHQLRLKTSVDESSTVIMNEKNNLQACPKYQKAFAGIGFIFGLAGFFFWLKGKKKRVRS